jgi:hypothetical protein
MSLAGRWRLRRWIDHYCAIFPVRKRSAKADTPFITFVGRRVQWLRREALTEKPVARRFQAVLGVEGNRRSRAEIAPSCAVLALFAPSA